MDTTVGVPVEADALPDHTQLPDKDDAVVTNYQEHPQSEMLTTSLTPRLRELYGDRFSVGRDNGIYWKPTDPPLKGCKSPDWFLVPGVPAMLDGQIRRSYVLWKEKVRPLVVIEYVSGDGSEEHDRTPESGKFWVYEKGVEATYYVIFDGFRGTLEVHLLRDGVYHRLAANEAGRVPIPPLGIEVGLWEGKRVGIEGTWLRAWDAATGELLPTAEEREEAERQRAEEAESLVDDARRMRDEETERAENERKRADDAESRVSDAERRLTEQRQRLERLAQRLRESGVDPDSL